MFRKKLCSLVFAVICAAIGGGMEIFMKKDLTFEEEVRRERISDGFTSPLVAACLICFLQVLLGALQDKIFRSVPESEDSFLLYLLLPLLFSGISVLVPFYIYNRLIGEKITPLFKRENLSVNPLVLLCGILSVCSFGVLFRFFSMQLTGAMEASGFVFTRAVPPTYNPALFILFSSLIPAVFYELAFRGILAERLKFWSPAAAVILSAMVYSFCHLSLDIIPHTFVCGLLLSWLYIKTNSIVLTAAANAMTNAVIAALWVFDSLSVTAAVIGGAVGVSGLIGCWFLLKKEPGTKKNEYSGKEVLRAVFTSFALYVFLVITFLGLMFYHINKPDPEQQTPPLQQEDNSFVIETER